MYCYLLHGVRGWVAVVLNTVDDSLLTHELC